MDRKTSLDMTEQIINPTLETQNVPDTADVADDAMASSAPNANAEHEESLPHAPIPMLRIRPTSGWRAVDLRELWRYRELLFFFTWRDIKVRYKQTILGATWAVIQPLMTTGIFSVLFALLMGKGNEPTVPGVPYPLSTFCAMLPWQLFAFSLTQSGNSLITSQNLITKVYFPRLVIPLSAVLSGLVDFAVAFAVLIAGLLWYEVQVDLSLLMLPAFILMALGASVAVGLWLAALTAIYRDFRYIIPFIVQVGMFASPVVYSTDSVKSKLPDWAFQLYSLNPMVGVIEGFRWSLLGTGDPPGLPVAFSALMTTLLFVSGLLYFRRMERTFADVV